MSWDSSPSRIHQDVIAHLLSMYKERERQQKTSNNLVSPEYDDQKGRLRCRAIIKDARLHAILKSDPSDWNPSESKLTDFMAMHHERTMVEIWEDRSDAAIIAYTSTKAPMLRKMADSKSFKC